MYGSSLTTLNTGEWPIELGVRLLRDVNLVLSKRRLNLSDQIWSLLVNDGVVDQLRDGIEEEGVLGVFNFSQDHQVFRGIVEAFSLHGTYVVLLRVL